MNPAIEKLYKEAKEQSAQATTPVAPLPAVRMGTCAKCGRGDRKVFKGGDVYWCRPCIRHEERRREKGKKQEGV